MVSSRAAEVRQRAAKACLPCKTAKKRCTGGIPCTYCVNHRRGFNCRYADDAPAQRAAVDNDATGATSIPAANPSSNDSIFPSPSQIPGVTTPATFAAADHASNPVADSVDTNSPATSMSFVPPRILRNPKGNQVYVGSNAIISFLPFIRSVFKRSVGPSTFTEQTNHGVMLESDSQSEGQMQERETTSFSQKADLVKLFFAATSGVLDIVEATDILETLRMEDSGLEVDPHRSAISSLAVAIGAQCHPDATAFRVCERAHFERARPHFSLDKLEDFTLDTIRLFMLAAFYMLCVSNRNMGYMYLGLAARAAHVMGLHHVGLFPNLDDAEKDSRIRVWKSLRVLETLVSSFLGRPAATLHPYREPTGGQLTTSPPATPRSPPIDAIYSLLDILDDVQDQMARQNNGDFASAKACFDRLTAWSSMLPRFLRAATSEQPAPVISHQELTLGNLHVACSYYFAVVLVTRPFLVCHCLSKQSQREAAFRSESGNDPSSATATVNADIAMLAKSCEDAAVFMASACHDALEEETMLDNMCLIQAFIFAAALILGLVLFTDSDCDKDVEKSLHAAVAVMGKLSRRSRQAEHYLWILRDMRRDIERLQEQTASKRRESSQRPVKKLLQLTGGGGIVRIADTTALQDPGTGGPRDDPGSSWALPDDVNLGNTPLSAFAFPYTNAATGIPDVTSWDFPSIQFWDDFSMFGTG